MQKKINLKVLLKMQKKNYMPIKYDKGIRF